MAKAKNNKKIKIYIDPVANSFNIWWDNPKLAYSSEEVDSPYRNDVLIKDKRGRPISLEVIGIFPSELNIAEKSTKYLIAPKNPISWNQYNFNPIVVFYSKGFLLFFITSLW